MPEKRETIVIPHANAESLLAWSLGAFQKLGWTVKLATPEAIIAYTPKSWKRNEDMVSVRASEAQIEVVSQFIHGEKVDILNKNMAHLAEFRTAFDAIRNTATDEEMGRWQSEFFHLQQETRETIAKEQQQAKEVDNVMKFSGSNLYLTYAIIGLNALVFILMVINGVSVFAPTGADIIRWGADFAPLTLSGDWWRLLSCVFVHIGIVHLAFNMYALYMAGVYLEPMLGKARFLVAYVCTGVFASLASLWWHTEPVPSAGASGAIFGLYGVFAALLTTKLIPEQIRNGLLKSIGIFIVYNLLYGLKSGVDNAAHVGGLLSGAVIGYLFLPGLRPGASPQRKTSLTMAAIVLTALVTVVYLGAHKEPLSKRQEILAALKDYSYKDADKFETQMLRLSDLENKGLSPLSNDSLNPVEKVKQLKEISIPAWNESIAMLDSMKDQDISPKSKARVEDLGAYLVLRKEQAELFSRRFGGDSTVDNQLDSINVKITGLLAKLNNGD